MHAVIGPIIIYEELAVIIPYPRKRGPMGGAPYTGPRLGDGPIFEVNIAFIRERAPR